MKLTDVIIYPIKSLGGIRLDSTKVAFRGLENDRRMMLVRSDGLFITQRDFPSLSQLNCSYEEDTLVVYEKGNASNSIRIATDTMGEIEVQVFDDYLVAHKVNLLHNDFFSSYLGASCTLVQMGRRSFRKTKIGKSDVSLADGYPYLVLGENSLKDLNKRLDTPVSIDRFRPNLVFEGGEPFEEDNWSKFRIGSASFDMIKPCARCIMTTIDPDTAKKGKEPLKTLQSYRMVNNNVNFGANAIALTEGIISVGDEIVFS